MQPTIAHKQAFASQFLSLDEVKIKAPSAFTKLHSTRASGRYLPIVTPDVIEDLIDSNWHPIDAYQVRPKKEENKGFQKHFISFRNPKVFVGTKDAITIIPQILLVNSYDARSSFKLYMSLYRVVCENGLIVKSDELNSLNIPHKGWQHEDWIELKRHITKNTTIAISLMDKLSKVHLTPFQQKQFAQECCRARWDYTYKLNDTKSLLEPLRIEDESNDMFTIYNRIQEKLIKGGWRGRTGRTIKALVNRDRELNVNSRLFQIVENFYQQLIKQKS